MDLCWWYWLLCISIILWEHLSIFFSLIALTTNHDITALSLCHNWISAFWNLWDIGMFRSGQRLTADMGSGDEQQALCSSSQACSNSSSPTPSWLLCAFKMWIHGFCRTCLFFLGLQGSWSLSGSYHSLLAIQVLNTPRSLCGDIWFTFFICLTFRSFRSFRSSDTVEFFFHGACDSQGS